MKDPMTIVGSNRQNIGIGITRAYCEEGKYWHEPHVQNHLLRMLSATRRGLVEMCGLSLGRLDGPERHLVHRGTPSFVNEDDHGVSLVLKNKDWQEARSQEHFHTTDSTIDPKGKRLPPEFYPPRGGADVEHPEGESILWNMWMLSLKTPFPSSPFGHALRNLTTAFQKNPNGVNVPLLWDSGVVCVPLRVRPFHWRNRRGADGVPRFQDSRYRDLDGFILAVHRHLPRDMVRDIKEANRIEARIMNDEKGHIVGDHERRLLQIFPGARLHVFAASYAAHLKGKDAEELRERLKGSEFDFVYNVELDDLAFLQTYEDLDELLGKLEASLYFGEQTEEKAVETLEKILVPPEAIRLPAKEVALPSQPVSVPAFASLSEVRAWEAGQKVATG